jgi:hypothetical protein
MTSTGHNRRYTDPMILKTFAVTMAFTRAWLLLRGHVRASKDLASITYDDAEEAFDRLAEEARRPMSEARAKQILGSLQGGPKGPSSVLPSASLARLGHDQ